MAASPALAGTTPPSAISSSGLTGLGDLTGAPSSPSIFEPIVSGDGRIIAINAATNTGTNAYTIDATNGWKLLAKPGTSAGWEARGISTDGAVIAGNGSSSSVAAAVMWKAGTATVLSDLSSVKLSWAWGVSGDGHVVVGESTDSANVSQAVKWVDGGAPVKLTGTGFTGGSAQAASSDGSVIVGMGKTAAHRSEAFRWTSGGGMVSLGLLSDASNFLAFSQANGVSSDGSVVVGTSFNATEQGQAFRWTQAGGMVGLGFLSTGKASFANGVNGDGSIVVGTADTPGATANSIVSTGFVWTQAGGMKSVSDYLTGKGVTVASGSDFHSVQSVSNDGSVLVGEAKLGGTEQAYIARLSASGGTSGGGGTGVVGVTTFLGTVGQNGAFQAGVASTMAMALDGAHHRTLNDYGLPGGSCAWATGDLGGSGNPRRRQYFGEVGLCHDVAPGLRVGFGGGYGHVSRDLPLGGKASGHGWHLDAEADLTPAGSPLTLSVLGYYASWDLRLARAYTNGASVDTSTATPAAQSWALRARVDWKDMLKLGGVVGLSPYLSYAHSHTRIDAYTETGGGFPVTVAKSGRTGDEARLGASASLPVAGLARLALSGEYVHRFDDGSYAMRGSMVGGLAPFAFATQTEARDWGRFGLDLDVKTGAASVLSFSAKSTGGTGRDADVSGSVSFRLGF
ncbi:MAG: autotransporter domain-containing protein [Sphingomonadales bacterium]|nr:autotransporter domain-containing protein [Sphingomonadales bacterium]